MPIKQGEDGKFIRQTQLWGRDKWDEGYVDNDGRFRVYRPDYPRAYSNGYALRAHVVWWLCVGRPYPADKEIHHIDGNKQNDKFTNLCLVTHTEHMRIHFKKFGELFFCENCNEPFFIPTWRVTQRRKEGQKIRFCSQKCYHAFPRKDRHKQAISDGLKRAYAEGIR